MPKWITSANNGTSGTELWVTDGTAAGTSLLKDIFPGSASSNASYFTSLGNGQIVFRAISSSVGFELWISDGTAAGTSLLRARAG